jgi:hypothetical protein
MQKQSTREDRFFSRPRSIIFWVLLVTVMEAGKLMAFEVGQPFPLILLPSLKDGNPMSVADFRGKKLVLHIWASW